MKIICKQNNQLYDKSKHFTKHIKFNSLPPKKNKKQQFFDFEADDIKSTTNP